MKGIVFLLFDLEIQLTRGKGKDRIAFALFVFKNFEMIIKRIYTYDRSIKLDCFASKST